MFSGKLSQPALKTSRIPEVPVGKKNEKLNIPDTLDSKCMFFT